MRLNQKFAITALLLALASLPTCAAEIANLRNGFSIRFERHELRDQMVRLYLSDAADDYVDLPSNEIVSFEKEEVPVPRVSTPQLVATPAPVSVPTLTLPEVVNAASKRNAIDPDLIHSVIRVESGSNPKAVSPKGAQGLMQLMPETAARLGIENPLDPTANVEGGTRYLRELLQRYHNDLAKALAAYNAGPDRVERFHGIPPYRETRIYVARVISDLNRTKLGQGPQVTKHTNRRAPSKDAKKAVRQSSSSSALSP